jgi:gas vesicle protein
MNAEELTFTLNSVLSILFGAGGAMGVWFTLKGQIKLMKQRIESIEETDKTIHKRIDRMKEEVVKNRERSDHSVQEIKGEMNKMELRIIQAIHEIKK